MKHFIFGIKYLFNHQVLHKRTPLIGGLVVHNKCNLRCRHCRIPQRGAMSMSHKQVQETIESLYRQGGRTIYFEGGEPFLWSDGDYGLDDIVVYAKKMGFLATIIYTNGTFQLESSADTIFISLDGLQATHDHIRGKSFDQIMLNIHQSTHPSLFINYTINNLNKNEILDFCEFINEVPNIRGIFFYFHTPYYGHDDLYIDLEEKTRILRQLLKHKRKYKILNSAAGLRSAIKNNWKRPLEICKIYENGKTYTCCRYPDDPELCEKCGYLSYAEISETLKLKPSAIINALKYF